MLCIVWSLVGIPKTMERALSDALPSRTRADVNLGDTLFFLYYCAMLAILLLRLT